jgi:DNA-binding IclR family transcriptional regulator
MTDLSVIGGGDTVAVSAPTGTQALVMFGARSVSHNTAGSRVLLSYAVDGATTIAAAAGTATDDESTAADSLRSPGREHLRTGLTTGVNIFTLQVQPVGAASGSITVRNPYLIVWPL